MSDEIFDVIDLNGKLLGKTVRRGIDPLAEGEYHLAVDVIFLNAQKQLLLQKRAACKKSHPNLWGPTGGAVQAGETAVQGLLRECAEEIGIVPDLSKTVATFREVYHHTIIESRLIAQEIALESLRFQESEVCDAAWLSADEVQKLLDEEKNLPSTIAAVEKIVALVKKLP